MIKITNIEENSLLTELSPKETAAINGGLRNVDPNGIQENGGGGVSSADDPFVAGVALGIALVIMFG